MRACLHSITAATAMVVPLQAARARRAAALKPRAPARQESALLMPQLYRPGQANASFRLRVLALWLASALWQSLVCFYAPMWALAPGAVSRHGRALGLWDVGTLAYTLVVVMVRPAARESKHAPAAPSDTCRQLHETPGRCLEATPACSARPTCSMLRGGSMRRARRGRGAAHSADGHMQPCFNVCASWRALCQNTPLP